jgi:hypothetical protein
MARVLALTVAELSNDRVCSEALRGAGFNNGEIAEHLSVARRIARQRRTSEINQRYNAMWNEPDGN